MADEQARQDQPGDAGNPDVLDPAFFTSVNEYLELANRHSVGQGLKRTSLASLYAAARFNSHVFLSSIQPGQASAARTSFLDQMGAMYRRMLNEHLDGLGQERNIDVGVSELAAEYAAAGVQVGKPAATSTGNNAATAAAIPPASE